MVDDLKRIRGFVPGRKANEAAEHAMGRGPRAYEGAKPTSVLRQASVWSPLFGQNVLRIVVVTVMVVMVVMGGGGGGNGDGNGGNGGDGGNGDGNGNGNAVTLLLSSVRMQVCMYVTTTKATNKTATLLLLLLGGREWMRGREWMGSGRPLPMFSFETRTMACSVRSHALQRLLRSASAMPFLCQPTHRASLEMHLAGR